MFSAKCALCFCALLCSAFSARINKVSSFTAEAQHRSDDSGPPKEMCSQSKIVRRACAILRQEATYLSKNEEPFLTTSQLRDYFIAEPDDIDNFMNSVNPALQSWFPCRALCEGTLRYIAEYTDYVIPTRHGMYCKKWRTLDDDGTACVDWQPIGDDAMTDIAHSMDLSNEMKLQSVDEEGDGDDDASVRHWVNSTEASGSNLFHYGTGELAMRIAKIFDVFPSLRNRPGNPASLLQKEDRPPAFGPKVLESRYAIWYDTMKESEAWVTAALDKLPHAPGAVQAWFGKSDAQTYKAVREGLVGMVKTLTNTKIKVGGPPTCAPEKNTMAFVMQYSNSRTGQFLYGEKEKDTDGSDRQVINICERYWKAEFIASPADKFGTIVHESSHHQGTDDESYDGAAPYGAAQCLRMASEAPEKALNNADNFKWLVYYLNHCADSPTSVTTISPCTLKLAKGERGVNVEVTATCTKEVKGLILKNQDGSGKYLMSPPKFGTLSKGSWILNKSLEAPHGSFVKIFFEYECAMWEASVEWKGSQASRPATKVLDLTHPGTNVSSENASESVAMPLTGGTGATPTPLPCALTLDTDVRLAGGMQGFRVLVKCTRDVSNAQLRFAPNASFRQMSSKGQHITRIGKVKSGADQILFTGKIAEFKGYKFELSGKVGSSHAVVEVILQEEPEPLNRKLPCEISMDDTNGRMMLDDGREGFALKLRCSEQVTDGELDIPGTEYKGKKYPGTFKTGATYTLDYLAVSEWVGKTLMFKGSFAGAVGSVSTEPIPARLAPLPCELILYDYACWAPFCSPGSMTMEDGHKAFEIRLKCSETITDVVLRIPDSSDIHRSIQGAGDSYTFIKLPKAGNEGIKYTVEAKCWDTKYEGKFARKLASVSATLGRR